MGRSPDLIEDQITYPIVTALISTPHVKAVRGFTDFGISYVYVIFEDGTDIYWARSRVVEYLQGIRGQLPEGVNPGHRSGRDRRGLGVRVRARGRHRPAHAGGPAELPGLVPALLAGVGAGRRRSREHRRVREAVPGERSIPNKLAAYQRRHRRTSSMAIKASNNDVEGRLLEFSGREYMVRGRGYLKSIDDIEQASSLGAGAARHAGARARRGDGRGSARTSGGASPSSTARAKPSAASSSCASARTRLSVIDAREGAAAEVQALDARRACAIVPTYDRSGLIRESISTLRRTLIEEAIVVSLVHLVVPVPLPVRAHPDPRAADRRARVVHPDVLPRRHVEHHVARRPRAGDRRAGGRLDRDGGERVPAHLRDAGRAAATSHRGSAGGSDRGGQAGRPRRSSSRWRSSSCRSCRCSCSRRRKAGCSGRWRSRRRSRWRRRRCCRSRSCRC